MLFAAARRSLVVVSVNATGAVRQRYKGRRLDDAVPKVDAAAEIRWILNDLLNHPRPSVSRHPEEHEAKVGINKHSVLSSFLKCFVVRGTQVKVCSRRITVRIIVANLAEDALHDCFKNTAAIQDECSDRAVGGVVVS